MLILATNQTDGVVFFCGMMIVIAAAWFLPSKCRLPVLDVAEPESHEPPALTEADIRRVLSNIASGVAKIHDAPCSAQTHFDTAIALLAEHTDWRPESDELAAIVTDAVDHMDLHSAFRGNRQ